MQDYFVQVWYIELLEIIEPNVTINGLHMYAKVLYTVSKPYYYGNKPSKELADVLK